MKALTNREFAGRLTELIYEIREDYRECYNKTELEYVCERLADELRESLSYQTKEYHLLNFYLDEIQDLRNSIDKELNSIYSDFMDDFINIIDYESLCNLFLDLKDPASNKLFDTENEDFDLEFELEEIMSNPNNLAYDLVKDKLDYYFWEGYIPQECYEWGAASDYDKLEWARQVLEEYCYLLSPEEREFIRTNIGREV